MKFRPSAPGRPSHGSSGGHAAGLDSTDRAILDLLQENCKQPLAAIGEKVGLSAPSVVERIHKLEEAGVITDYVALLDARRVGKDVTAFIGVSANPTATGQVERQAAEIPDVLECHHVTGAHTLMLKLKTRDTQSLEEMIAKVRSIEGVTRTETMVVLSTHAEHPRVTLGGRDGDDPDFPPPRRSSARSRRPRS